MLHARLKAELEQAVDRFEEKETSSLTEAVSTAVVHLRRAINDSQYALELSNEASSCMQQIEYKWFGFFRNDLRRSIETILHKKEFAYLALLVEENTQLHQKCRSFEKMTSGVQHKASMPNPAIEQHARLSETEKELTELQVKHKQLQHENGLLSSTVYQLQTGINRLLELNKEKSDALQELKNQYNTLVIEKNALAEEKAELQLELDTFKNSSSSYGSIQGSSVGSYGSFSRFYQKRT